MATESPLIHDGAQTTASVNMSSTASLSGYAGSGQFLGVVISGSRTVAYDSTGGAEIYGILQNQPASGQVADVGILGISKAMAGGTIAAGADLMTNSSGELITATSTNHRFATAIEAAVSGQIFTVWIHGSNRTA